MSKTISAGIIVKVGNRYVVGHATGQSHFDIFKGRQEVGETYIETALRECFEESNLQFKAEDLTFLGKHVYTKKKDLVLFMIEVNEVAMSDLRCWTHLDNGNYEMDYYATFEFEEMTQKVGPSMGKLLASLRKEIEGAVA